MKWSLSLTLAISLGAVLTASGASIEYRFFQGMRDGAEPTPDGAEYIVLIEEEIEDENPTEVYRLHSSLIEWTEEQAVNLDPFAGRLIYLKTLASPGPDRNTGWDWLAIGEPRITVSDNTEWDLLQMHRDAASTVSMILDADKNDPNDVVGKETPGLGFGATAGAEFSTCGGVEKDGIFQHPAWNGQTGDVVVRWEIDLTGLAVKPTGKLATSWADIKGW